MMRRKEKMFDLSVDWLHARIGSCLRSVYSRGERVTHWMSIRMKVWKYRMRIPKQKHE